MDIKNIKSVFDTLCKIDCRSFVRVKDLAKELKLSSVALMVFIGENPKLFSTSERWKPKTVKYTTNFHGKRYKAEKTVKGESLGICIESVYLSGSDNPCTQEWLDKIIVEKAKYIYLQEADNYGEIMGYYIIEDTPSEDRFDRKFLWRNTKEKLNWLTENKYTKADTFWFGGFGDSYSTIHQNAISPSSIEKLQKLGWTFNQFKQITKHDRNG